ncbi:MAG: SMP-30/gluconolactonase/LRE family protein [Solirubrobacteraceae bacterium]
MAATSTASAFVAPRLVRLAETDAHEGPVYVPEEDALYFTSVPRASAGGPVVDIKRLGPDGALTVVRADANVANGMTLDAGGRLIVCEQGGMRKGARIARVDRHNGASETVVERWQGLPLNSPNDVVVSSDGTIWFTDPSYGHVQGFRPEPLLADAVYRHDPVTGHTTVVAEGFDKPNGLVFAPDESLLYVGDSGADRIDAFDVVGGHRLTGRRLFALTRSPDGLAVDADGNLYASSPTGIAVSAPGGERIGEIRVPGAVNFTWGGAARNVLFITADTAVWAAVLHATAAPTPPTRQEA